MVILSIDVGTVRVGCAVADSSTRISFPVAVWPKAKNQAEVALLKEITDRAATVLVVGMPYGPNGERTAMCETAENFARRISKRSPITIAFVDESFSSEEAHERARHASSSAQAVDAFAACLILDRYLQEISEGK
jgi:putative Holliday junction resolvase